MPAKTTVPLAEQIADLEAQAAENTVRAANASEQARAAFRAGDRTLGVNINRAADQYRTQAERLREQARALAFRATTRQMKRAELLATLSAKVCQPDALTLGADGAYTFKRGFFYTHGNSAQGYAERIKAAFPDAVILETRDAWKSWPARSYFLVRFYFPAEPA